MDKQEATQSVTPENATASRGVLSPNAVFFPHKNTQPSLEVPVAQASSEVREEVTVAIATNPDNNAGIAITFDVPNLEAAAQTAAQEGEAELEEDFADGDVKFNQDLQVKHNPVQDDSSHLDVTARFALERVQVAVVNPVVHAQTTVAQSEIATVVSEFAPTSSKTMEMQSSSESENTAVGKTFLAQECEKRHAGNSEVVQEEKPTHKLHKFFDGTEREVKLSQYYPEYEFDVEDFFKDAPVIMEGKGLSKDYHIKTGFFKKTTINAVKNVDFKLRAGETLSIVGESGSGKTTLAKLIANIEKHDSGELFFKGESLKNDNSEAAAQRRKEISVIFQNPHASLNPRKTIYKALEEPLLLNTNLNAEERRAKIEEMIQLVGLKVEHLKRLPHMFSGGQKQRIAIARGLILNPSIVVADEAVSALDVSVQAQILNLMLKLQKLYNLSYIFISHDLSVVKHISHRIMVMYHGDIVEEGTTEEIFHNPQHEYTKTLMASVPKLPEVCNK